MALAYIRVVVIDILMLGNFISSLGVQTGKKLLGFVFLQHHLDSPA